MVKCCGKGRHGQARKGRLCLVVRVLPVPSQQRDESGGQGATGWWGVNAQGEGKERFHWCLLSLIM